MREVNARRQAVSLWRPGTSRHAPVWRCQRLRAGRKDGRMGAERVTLVVLDDGSAAGLDGVALAVAAFGHGRFRLTYAPDVAAIRAAAPRMRTGCVAVVNVDDDRFPKQTVADISDTGLPVVVLTDGTDETIAEHAASTGAAACLALSVPGRELVSMLEMLAR